MPTRIHLNERCYAYNTYIVLFLDDDGVLFLVERTKYTKSPSSIIIIIKLQQMCRLRAFWKVDTPHRKCPTYTCNPVLQTHEVLGLVVQILMCFQQLLLRRLTKIKNIERPKSLHGSINLLYRLNLISFKPDHLKFTDLSATHYFTLMNNTRQYVFLRKKQKTVFDKYLKRLNVR